MIVSHPYFPARPGSWISYYRSAVPARYIPETMDFQLTGPAVMINDGHANPWRRTIAPIRDACYPAASIVLQNDSHVCPDDWDMWCNSLYLAHWQSEDDPTQGWLGESGGMQIGWFDGSAPEKSPAARMSLGFPPEPYIPLDIDAYKTPISGTTRGLSFDRSTLKNKAVALDWKFRNWGRGPGPGESWEWGDRFPKQIRCVLRERPATNGPGANVFMYDYALGVGPICMWQGQVEADNSISGGLMFQIADFRP